MRDIFQRGLAWIRHDPTSKAYFGYCSSCSRFYTVFTHRTPIFACPKCAVVFRKHVSLTALKNVWKEMQQPMRTDSIVRWLADVFNRTRISTIRAWWADNQRLNKASVADVLAHGFSGLPRSEVTPRSRTVRSAMMYELTLVQKISERVRFKYKYDGFLTCNGCEKSVNPLFMLPGSCIHCSEQLHFQDIQKLLRSTVPS